MTEKTFDFSSAVAAAKAVTERQEGQSNVNYTYPLVYPQVGQTIVIRPLFNPKSGQIIRLVTRHEKVACYKTYGIECPICAVQQQVKDMTGQDPFGRSKKSRSRGICFAQYISSTAPYEKSNGQGQIQPGDIILFMFPWSVYTQINATISAIGQTPTGMDQAFCHAQSGLYLQISVSPDYKYTTTNVPYMTFPTQQTDDEFMTMLEGMESLAEQVLPSTITEEVDKQVKEYTDAIYRQFINPQVPNQAPPVTPQPMQVTPNPTATSYNPIPPVASTASAPTVSVPNNGAQPSVSLDQVPFVPDNVPNNTVENQNPPCFGKHQENSPQCICCPAEMTCTEASK